MKTFCKRKEDVVRQWFLIDAEGKTLGRLCTRIADILHGKLKVDYTPHVDGGDHVVVINASKVRLTGKKLEKKEFYRHSGYPGGLKRTTAGEVKEKFPQRLILHAVQGMLPKSKLGRAMLKKLRVYAGPEHPHSAQCPQPVVLK
jgi:large subunit ribosomal protein L13